MAAPAPVVHDGDDILLSLRVQPRASRNELLADETGGIRLRLTAAPVDGDANRMACRLLADAFGVSASRVSLQHGARGRSKRFRIRAPTRWPKALCALHPAHIPPGE